MTFTATTLNWFQQNPHFVTVGIFIAAVIIWNIALWVYDRVGYYPYPIKGSAAATLFALVCFMGFLAGSTFKEGLGEDVARAVETSADVTQVQVGSDWWSAANFFDTCAKEGRSDRGVKFTVGEGKDKVRQRGTVVCEVVSVDDSDITVTFTIIEKS